VATIFMQQFLSAEDFFGSHLSPTSLQPRKTISLEKLTLTFTFPLKKKILGRLLRQAARSSTVEQISSQIEQLSSKTERLYTEVKFENRTN
jgi:hypothetical protein